MPFLCKMEMVKCKRWTVHGKSKRKSYLKMVNCQFKCNHLPAYLYQSRTLRELTLEKRWTSVRHGESNILRLCNHTYIHTYIHMYIGQASPRTT